MLEDQELMQWFRASTAYINAHRGKVFVVYLSGDALDCPNFANIVHDLALLHSLDVKLVLVYGARPQISAALAAEGIESSYQGPLRVTEASHMQTIKRAVGCLGLDLQAHFSMGLSNSPMHGANINVSQGNFVTAQPIGVIDGVDFQYSGKVRRVDTEAITHLLAGNQLVLVSNLGYSVTGEIFNLAAEEVATELAIALNAEKLIQFMPTPGIVDDTQQLITALSASSARKHLASLSQSLDAESVAQASSLQSALRAYEQGIHRCHLISYKENGALLQELFTRAGHGSLLSRDSLDELRAATIEDVGGILNLIQPLELAGALVTRSRELLETEIENFIVIELEETIIGCAALYPLSGNAAEIACIAIHPDYQKSTLGERLLLALEKQARQMKATTVYALTTVASHFFMERGFTEISVDELPQGRQKLYNYQRKSKVFTKTLDS
ncbi:MAG TPA: amino-acid N-acetyltransferase [Gammaproteobacteria bacterium]|nr:amino-acid N-acetyltransferase [Gammaproteobacteria bacterium]HAU23427.1 amino-acid N-acetyltransferase [Gammaproteobacteria bacterium]|tara:strand:+ start:7833 stop:9161 length:1329 start_codon:yes stop_codon:yes gene_type:complete